MKELKARILQDPKARLLLSLVLVALGIFLERLLSPYHPGTSVLAFFLPVLFALLYLEFKWTMLASLFSFQYFILARGSLKFSWPQDFIGLFLFAGACLAIFKVFQDSKQEIERGRNALQQELNDRFTYTTKLALHLKAPLSLMKLGSQFLTEHDPQSEKFRKAIKLVADTGEKLVFTMNDLVDASTLASGKKLDLLFRETYLRALVNETLSPLEKEHPGRFKVDINSDGSKALWNEEGIARVVRTLCSQAIQFGDGTPADVQLYEDKDHASLSVRYKGPSMTEDQLKDLFIPFKVMLTSQPSPQQESLGLNLPLLKGIIEAHGGNIKVVSNQDEGTVFQILLPKKLQPA